MVLTLDPVVPCTQSLPSPQTARGSLFLAAVTDHQRAQLVFMRHNKQDKTVKQHISPSDKESHLFIHFQWYEEGSIAENI